MSSRAPAIFDENRVYRYVLRRWLMLGQERPHITFIMLNPSTADESIDDPTIRRCMGFAHEWGFAFMEVVNLFALRATNPMLLQRTDDPIGPDNDFYIQASAYRANRVVCAWGNHGALNERGDAVLSALAIRIPERIVNLGLTKIGQPRHPLYLSASTKPQPFTSPAP